MKKKILIFGSEGQLGHDLAAVLAADYQVKAFSRVQADITDFNSVFKIITREKPEFVINAAAYNKVEAAETQSDLAFTINASAVGNMASAAANAGGVFVHVSSDYVFAGNKALFTEADEPNPLSAYGQSKLKGEKLIQSSQVNYYLIRTSSVFGIQAGKQKMNFVDTIIARAKEDKALKVVDDQIMSPTYSFDLAGKIKELIEKPAPFGIYHVSNQGSCSWYEFAQKILELMSINAPITPISTEESGTKVNRPKKSILKNLALEKEGFAPMPTWQDALSRYLKEKYK